MRFLQIFGSKIINSTFYHYSKTVANLIVYIILTIVLFFSAGFSQHVESQSLNQIIDSAYMMLNVNISEAEQLLQKAVSINPTNIALRNQLGYTYHSQKKYELAIEQFQISDSLNPSDTIKLQIAFDLISSDKQDEAKKILYKLESSNNSSIREAAINQLSVLTSSEEIKKWWTWIYLSPYYDTRWKTSIYYGNIESGFYLREDKKLSAYGFILMSGDGRSKGGLSPIVFSDNALIFGLGFKFDPMIGLQFKVQQGMAFDLIQINDHSIKKGDFRAIAIYNNGIYPNLNLHDNVQVPFTLLLDVYTSLGYYSRYDNGIWYLQGRGGTRIFELRYSAIDFYAKGAIARDIKKEFYNNLFEGGIGVRMIPNLNWGLYLIGEFQRGYYWDVSTSANPYEKYYNSLRLFIVFEKIF